MKLLILSLTMLLSFSSFASTLSCNTVSKNKNEDKNFYILGKRQAVTVNDMSTGRSYSENYDGLSIEVEKKVRIDVTDENGDIQLVALYAGNGVYTGVLKLSTFKEAFVTSVNCTRVN